MNNTGAATISLLCLLLGGSIIKAQVILKTCSRDNLLDCPNNSLCTQINVDHNEALKCICIENYQLNPNWSEYEHLNNSILLQEHYCLASKDTAEIKQPNKLLVYIRSPARKEHLAYGILMVLAAAALATAVLYGIKILKPLKKTKAVYQQLKYKRRNITPLQELDELEMNRRYEMQTI
ncbi:hypothetical protein FF38_03292 [Lucilia cuprina]|uniref:Uncharacterized protein n=1 Tax=Lucilia cuprina TaxID=7375 RepID=A0A0L0BVZ7_LUCCU|nr:hypothetical protein FF38_03292 [Lucilia cuprina]